MEESSHIHTEACNLYGVDIHSGNITPEQVRDAMVNCFVNAHGETLKDFKSYENISEEEFEKIKRTDIESLIKGIFEEVGGDFNHPSKEMLIRVINKLAVFSKKFRSEDEVNKHYQEIKSLIDKIK